MKATALSHVPLAAMMFVVGAAVAVWLVLWVSLHSTAVRVPDIRGLEITRAIAVVQEAGLIVRVQEGVFAPDIDLGHVARQRPAPGLQLKRGGTVALEPVARRGGRPATRSVAPPHLVCPAPGRGGRAIPNPTAASICR